jgi:hypothetical protein
MFASRNSAVSASKTFQSSASEPFITRSPLITTNAGFSLAMRAISARRAAGLEFRWSEVSVNRMSPYPTKVKG